MAVGETIQAPPHTTRCAICGGTSNRHFEISGYWIRRCGECGHQFVELASAADHVERTYGDDYFSGGGAGYSDYLSEERLLIERGRWYARRLSRYLQPGAVLDIGAAAGFTLEGFRRADWQGCGIEPNPAMAEYARERFRIPVEAASLESWDSPRSFDLVTMLQVLPHFVDPRAALAKAAGLVAPGGHLVIESWNRQSWTARLLGKNWHEYSPPSVLHWFSIAGLVRLAGDLGLKPVARGRPSKWIDAAHAKSLLRHKAKGSAAYRLALNLARVIPDRAALPYPSEDLFWILFRRV